MVKSMTGYGQTNAELDHLKLEFVVRTLNGRYLDVKTHLPAEYQSFENDIKKIVGKKIKRGSVHLYIHRGGDLKDRELSLEVRPELGKEWIKSFKKLGKALDLKAEPALEYLIRIPEVMSFKENKVVSSKEKKAVLDGIKEVIESCDNERMREGKSLEKELTSLFQALKKNINGLEKALPGAIKDLQNKFRTRVQELLSAKINEDRLEQEIALLAEKADIREEIVRLSEHIETLTLNIGTQELSGKKLDFYVQELLRETNTIGSKSQNARMTRLVIDSKAIIEKIREQVQNIE